MSFSDTPLISVVIPTYGRPRGILKALNSIELQTYDRLEIIVVDDNGKGKIQEETKDFVINHRSRFPVQYFSHDNNKGYAAARNTGITAAQGKYIAFLDDDDEWLPSKCESQLFMFEEDIEKEIGLVYCRSLNMRANGDIYAEEPANSGFSGRIYEALLSGDVIGASSKVMFRRSALDSVGPLDETLPTRADHDLFLRVASKFLVGYVDEPLVNFYVDGLRITGNVDKKIKGWCRFLEKWDRELNKSRDAKNKIYYQQAFELGRLFYKNGNRRECFRWLGRAILLKPLKWKPYVLFLFSAFGIRLRLA